MYKEDLALNNLQWLICHKTQPNPTQLNDEKINATIRHCQIILQSSIYVFRVYKRLFIPIRLSQVKKATCRSLTMCATVERYHFPFLFFFFISMNLFSLNVWFDCRNTFSAQVSICKNYFCVKNKYEFSNVSFSLFCPVNRDEMGVKVLRYSITNVPTHFFLVSKTQNRKSHQRKHD